VYLVTCNHDKVMSDSTMRPANQDLTPEVGKLLDVSRLEKLGWKASTQLKEGLEATYQWFLANQNKFRC